MESRFLNFGRSKRDKPPTPKLETDFHSVPYRSANSPKAEPIFLHQPLRRSSWESKRIDDQDALLKSFAYDSLPQGKAPQFMQTAPKGNGPVKLQTSRRLSSGELFVTTQNNQRTLEDILEGEYIVSQSSQRDAAAHAPKLVASVHSGAPSRFSYALRSRPSTSRSARTNKDSNWSATPATPTSPMSHPALSLKSSIPTGLGILPPAIAQSCPPETQNVSSLDLTQNVAASKQPDEQNATIAALWRAEHGRLAKIYGQDAVNRDLLQLVNPTLARSLSQSSPSRTSRPSTAPLDPLPLPGLGFVTPKRANDGSPRSSTFRDDTSVSSSQNRESTSSSWTPSSASTTQTSPSDCDSPTTRENIRKMIEDMRSNYIDAIEFQTPPMIKKKSTKRRRKPRLGASPVIGETQSSVDRQTWHGHDTTSNPDDVSMQRRTASHPVQGVGRLSPIEASPSRSDMRHESDAVVIPPRELKRADSMTLGSLMLQIPESAQEPVERSHAPALDLEQRPKTVATSDERNWLQLNLPTSSFLTDLSQKEGSTTLDIAEFMKPRYIPDFPSTPTTTLPKAAPKQRQTLSLYPTIPPPRPAPPSMSLNELVNFI